jgi:hypothetical protein
MGEVNKKLVLCYNRGCGQTFDPDNNLEESCVYHSGEPYFHDAYKEWTCCHRKSTDFTEFLNFKGCQRGKHNGTRPISLDKPKSSANDALMNAVENIFSKCTSMSQKSVRKEEILDDLPLVSLTPIISPKLRICTSTKVESIDKDGPIPVGTPCKNPSCGVRYAEDINDECFYHPGTAIFHEGLKYWSCCRKKTTDFSKFLEQAGCTSGTHLWFKEKEKIDCRVDWHQTGGNVVVSVFAKNYDSAKSSISLSPTKLKVHVYFPNEEQIFERDYLLYSAVKVEDSTVSMLPTKIEIKLVKMFGDRWADLTKLA